MKRLLACCLTLAVPCAVLFSAPARAELPDPVRFSVVLEVGNVRQASAWLDAGLDPDFEGNLIGTGLMIGAWEGNIALMELFHARGADIHRVNRFGETALMLAAWKNRRTAMQWLLEHGARPNRPEREWTALHYASFAGHADLVGVLLAAGANVNARSTNGSTVVMMAAREGHGKIAQQLLAAGANPTLKNDFGDDAVAWAMRQGNLDIARAFTSAGNFAELARAAVARPQPQPPRSRPAPDSVEEHLRMARLAESQGRRDEALAAYRQALAELKSREAAQAAKVGAGKTAKTPQSLVIRARRGQPEKQAMAFTYASDASDVDRLLEQARAAEASGQRQEALRLFREVATRIKAGGETGAGGGAAY